MTVAALVKPLRGVDGFLRTSTQGALEDSRPWAELCYAFGVERHTVARAIPWSMVRSTVNSSTTFLGSRL